MTDSEQRRHDADGPAAAPSSGTGRGQANPHGRGPLKQDERAAPQADQSHEIAAEQAHLDLVYARLDEVREAMRQRLDSTLRDDAGGTALGLTERDAMVALYEERLAALAGADERLCFGRLDLRDGSRFYIGRVGLAEENLEPLLIDWRAPVAASFYQATARDPGDVVHRRHLTTRARKVLALEDDVLDLGALDAAERGHLVGEGALLAAVQAARTGRMGDIVATIQAEQDRVVRSELRGVLVVQGGPGTGKTVVALHRAAYLLYTHRERLSRNGVLLVGPSTVFLRYIERVLPALGETGVVMRTPGTLFHGVEATLDDEPEVAGLKGDLVMAQVLARALRQRQRTPAAPVTLDVDGTAITVQPAAFEAAIRHARASGKPHNGARPLFLKHLLDHMVLLLAQLDSPGARPDAEERAGLLEALLDAEEVRQAMDEAWGKLRPQELLADLYRDPRRLAAAAPDLAPARRRLLLREGDAAERWTIADVPLLDEAAELLGEDDRAAQLAARLTAARRQEEVDFARRALEYAGGDAAAFVSAETLADRFADTGPRLTVAQKAERDRGWAFGHIVVDEAQELSPMAWRLLMRRCPSRSMTLVGDIAQTSAAAGADSWGQVLEPYVGDRWRQVELTVNYRTPAAVMAVASAVLRAAGSAAPTPDSAREGEAPEGRRLQPGDLAALAQLVRAEHDALGERRMAVIAPAMGPWAAGPLAATLAAALPAGAVGQGDGALDAPVAVLSPRQSKGLEVDVVILVEPADILESSTRGINDLYVGITRATQRLVVAHARDLPGGMEGVEAA